MKTYVGYLSGFINFKDSTTDVQYSAENFSIHKENNWCYNFYSLKKKSSL